jgi:hypothetical protein
MPSDGKSPASVAELLKAIETSPIVTQIDAVLVLTQVRDGIITGEGPTTVGRMHYSRSLDACDAELCARILGAPAIDSRPVSRAEAETLFQIDEAAAERSDNGRFDDLFAKAIVHHATAASGLPVPPRAVALSPDTPIASWAPTQAVGVDTEVLEWISGQMRGRRRTSGALASVITLLIGAATLTQALPGIIDLGM